MRLLMNGKVLTIRSFPGLLIHLFLLFRVYFLNFVMLDLLGIFLAKRYNCGSDIALEFQLETRLSQLRQEPGQSIIEFHAQDRRQFIYFMMHIRDELENTRASLLHCSPLPTLKVALTELISEETCQQTRRVHSTDMVLATAPSRSSSPATPAAAVASSKPHRFNAQCHYCKEDSHRIFDCPKKKAKDAWDAFKAKASSSSKFVATVSTSSSVFAAPSSAPPCRLFL
ncbi:uncharacterized protein LOC131146474 [Malania oleifera]|uniref:uncharacterized protein LOC131146474 n=1 Tax=Malania oleifera TaxID=397392 RepID=UPI0025AE50D7|nr:uncharacterized protein LOC131146474 [Malania oleifera]XP_057952090.1 uncharacterized protein LOC131146474 [Malania oleifera]